MPLELKFESAEHNRVLAGLKARIELSERAIVKKETQWDKAEQDFTFYMKERDLDAIRRTARQGGTPQYTDIQVPYTYAQMMTAHTYLASVFLSRAPVLQFGGRHGESEMQVQAVESIMDYQTQVGGHLVPYFVWLHDALKYGVGCIGSYWEREESVVAQFIDEPVKIFGAAIPGKFKRIKSTRTILGYEGNRTYNIRPYDMLPDPRVPLSKLQEGEFFGRKVPIAHNTLVKRGASGQYFNIKAVEDKLTSMGGGGSSARRESVVSEFELPETFSGGDANHSRTTLVGTYPGIEMVVELIPTQWGLGSGTLPEKWVFTVLDKRIIIEAQPLGRYHNKFPFEILENEIEGYAFIKRGMFEIGRPLNEAMTWLLNSHFYAVRKSLNGDYVYDPSRIVSADINNSTGTGSRIRVTPLAYGTDVKAAISVLQGGADVTGTHMRDSEIMGGLLQRVLGVNDNLAGQVNPGGRKTATEIRTSTSGAINRLKSQAEFMSAGGWAPFSQQLLQTTQQMYTGEKKFRIVGDLAWNPQQGAVIGQDGFMTVDPESIAGFFDFNPIDGSFPLDRFAMVNMWSNLFQQVMRFPQIAEQYNMADIFAWVAQLAGIKNIKQFRIVPAAPGQVPEGVPLNGGENGEPRQPGAARLPTGGGPSNGAASGGGNGGPVIPRPNQIPGVGSSG